MLYFFPGKFKPMNSYWLITFVIEQLWIASSVVHLLRACYIFPSVTIVTQVWYH